MNEMKCEMSEKMYKGGIFFWGGNCDLHENGGKRV